MSNKEITIAWIFIIFIELPQHKKVEEWSWPLLAPDLWFVSIQDVPQLGYWVFIIVLLFCPPH